MNIYADASFLVSIYSVDTNSTIAVELMTAKKGTLWVTSLAELEFVNALGLRTFRRQITSAEAKASRSAFKHDAVNGVFQRKPMPDIVFVRARQLSVQTTADLGTKTSDLLHVAAALELGADEFYTFDRQQGKLAKEMKLKINSLS